MTGAAVPAERPTGWSKHKPSPALVRGGLFKIKAQDSFVVLDFFLFLRAKKKKGKPCFSTDTRTK